MYEVPACLYTYKELIHFRALAPELNVNGRSIQSFKKRKVVAYNKGVVMIKKPINSNFDHSNRFLTDYIPQNFAFTYAYVASPGA